MISLLKINTPRSIDDGMEDAVYENSLAHIDVEIRKVRAMLKYLETAECRNEKDPYTIRSEIKFYTERFRALLKIKQCFPNCDLYS